MANWYYYDQAGRKCGPVDSKTLKTLVQQSLITADTIIENEQGKSAKAGTIKGLEFPSRTIPAPPAYSDSPAASPSQNSSVEGTLFGMEPNTYFMLMHIVGFLFFPVAIVMWAIAKEKDTRADIHGKVIFNWLISLFIYIFIGSIACLIIIGIFVIIAVGICALIFPILAAIKASKGEIWKYPYSITFFQTGIPQQTIVTTQSASSIVIRKFIFLYGSVAILLICTVITIGFFNGEKQEVSEKKQEISVKKQEVSEKKQGISVKKQEISEKKQKDFYSAEIIEKRIADCSETIKLDLTPKERKVILNFFVRLQEILQNKECASKLSISVYLYKIERFKSNREIEIDEYIVNVLYGENIMTNYIAANNQRRRAMDEKEEKKQELMMEYYSLNMKLIELMLPESNRLSGNAHDAEEKERLDKIKREKEKEALFK
jgi:uncharacterized Tic20 family protein